MHDSLMYLQRIYQNAEKLDVVLRTWKRQNNSGTCVNFSGAAGIPVIS